MGYSAMAMADGMPKGGVLYTCEKDPKAARLSRELFEEHAYSPSTKNEGVTRKDATIELVEGDGLSSLALLHERNLRFDAVFLGRVSPLSIRFRQGLFAHVPFPPQTNNERKLSVCSFL